MPKNASAKLAIMRRELSAPLEDFSFTPFASPKTDDNSKSTEIERPKH